MPGLYTIPLSGLKEGSYSYDFELSGVFFEAFEGSEIQECELSLRVELMKASGSYDISFVLSGMVKVVCDRCLGEYLQSIESINRLIVKIGEEYDDSNPELLIIPASMKKLDISQYIYEYSHLSLPLRKVHPSGPDGKSTCDPDMIRRIVNADEISGAPGSEWDKLRN